MNYRLSTLNGARCYNQRPVKALAICGSTREKSSNLSLLKAIAESAKGRFELAIFEGLEEIPHFNPDIDGPNPPPQVTDLRRFLREAQGVLICTPEYAMGVPGTLKNAIDWTVSSCEFRLKPTALITASASGIKGHQSLLQTLSVLEARIDPGAEMIISGIKPKLSGDRIVHTETAQRVARLIDVFVASMERATSTSL